jgi:hypothetical protein
MRLFVNGSLTQTTTTSQNYTQTALSVGANRDGSETLIGQLAGLRLLKGTALYTATFVPPTEPLTAVAGTSLLLNFTNAGVVDRSQQNIIETVGNAGISTAVKKYGSSSMYFDGNGDYLIIPNSALSQFGSGNLTWEMWINTTSAVQYATLYSRTPSSFSTGMWSLLINLASATAGDLGLYIAEYSVNDPLLQSTGVNIRDGNWHHVAVVRNVNSWVLYVDGISRSSQTWAGTIATITAAIYVGADQFYGRNFQGYIDDLRITKGYARYTANFTPPTGPHRLK